MQIARHKVVTIDYTLMDDDGNVLDRSDSGEALTYLHGAHNIIPGLETALEGRTMGDSFSVTVSPEHAYGLRDNSKVQNVPREMFQDTAQIRQGDRYQATGQSGEQLIITVVEVNAEHVTVDGNHPLAGRTLHFDVDVKEVRDATAEEVAHGHVHGPGGHSHD
jgi:FKBP-type peptidyl-prolyl cis-trans isomerase SlyD